MRNKIYFDNNSTTELDPKVLHQVVSMLKSMPHNPSSAHIIGQKARALLINAKRSIARNIYKSSEEIVFTSGGTEGLNMLINGLARNNCSRIISSPIEHPSVLTTIKLLEKSGAVDVVMLPVDRYGAPRTSDLMDNAPSKSDLLVLSAANHETGVKLDVIGFSNVISNTGASFVLDSTSLIGKDSIQLPKGVTAMACSAHKFHGPLGVGFVFLKSGTNIPPLITGGEQEFGLRAGTENIPGIVGMAKALELCSDRNHFIYQKFLRDLFEELLFKNVDGISINGEGDRISNTSNIFFPMISPNALFIALDMAGIYVSKGTSCSSRMVSAPSQVLINMGHPTQRAHHSLRFSMSRFSTIKEVKRCVKVITKTINGK